MKNLNKKILALVLLMIMLCTSCRSITIEQHPGTDKPEESSPSFEIPEEDPNDAPASKEARAEQKEFDEYTHNIFIELISESAVTVHSYLSYPENYGITDAPYTLGETSEESAKKDIDDYKEYLKKLEEFDYNLLSKEQKLTYDILHTDLKDSIKFDDFYGYGSYLSSLSGIPISLPSFFGEFELISERDVKDYLELIKLIPAYYDDIMAYETERANKGMGIPDFQVDEVIDLCNEFITNVDDNFLITSFSSRIKNVSSISDSDKQKYIETNTDIVKNNIIPAYQKLISQLPSLKGKAKSDGGLCKFDNGDKYYELVMRTNTGSEKSVDEIKEMLTDKMQDDLSKIVKLSYKDPDLFDKLGEYSIDTSTPDKILQYLLKKIEDDFPEGCNTEYTVNDVPKDIEKYQSPAYYYIPHIDNNSKNSIYINRYSDYADTDLFSTLAHEGFPGHMYQTTYFQNTNPSEIRSLLAYDGYVEGWGLYAELYSYELAGLSSDLAEFNQVMTCFSYDLYCLADIGIHYEGWTREDLSDFLTKSGSDRSLTDEIYDVLVQNPAVYPAYYVGYLEFMEMRDEAMDTLGNNFNIKAFHKFILDNGPAQFEILKDRFEVWLKNQKSKA